MRGGGQRAAEAPAPLGGQRRWEVSSAGKGSKGERWYAWAWLATASPGHHLLVRRHLKTGELAFHYCYVPEGQAPPPVTPDQEPPPDPGKIPLTVPGIRRLLAARTRPPHPPGHAARWLDWRRCHQARSRWYHQRTRLSRDASISQVS